MSFNRAPVHAVDHHRLSDGGRRLYADDVVRRSDNVRARLSQHEAESSRNTKPPERPPSALPPSKPRAPWGLVCDTPRTRNDLTDQTGVPTGGGRQVGVFSPAFAHRTHLGVPTLEDGKKGNVGPHAGLDGVRVRPASAVARAPWEETDYRKVEQPAMWLAGPLNSPQTLFGERYVPRHMTPVAERNLPRDVKDAYLQALKDQAEEQRALRAREKSEYTGWGHRPEASPSWETESARRANQHASSAHAPYETDYNAQLCVRPARAEAAVAPPWEAEESVPDVDRPNKGIDCSVRTAKPSRNFDDAEKRAYLQELLDQADEQKMKKVEEDAVRRGVDPWMIRAKTPLLATGGVDRGELTADAGYGGGCDADVDQHVHDGNADAARQRDEQRRPPVRQYAGVGTQSSAAAVRAAVNASGQAYGGFGLGFGANEPVTAHGKGRPESRGGYAEGSTRPW